MTRAYNMYVAIAGYDPGRKGAIQEAACGEWGFEDWFEHEGQLTASGDGQLAGGETEEEFAERVAAAVWRANGAFCEVTVDATYMENLPYETHCRDEEDYARLTGSPAPPKDTAASDAAASRDDATANAAPTSTSDLTADRPKGESHVVRVLVRMRVTADESGEELSLEDARDTATEVVEHELAAAEAIGFTHSQGDEVSLAFIDAVPYEEDEEPQPDGSE